VQSTIGEPNLDALSRKQLLLFAEHLLQPRRVHENSAIIFNETLLTKLVHEEINARSRRADDFC